MSEHHEVETPVEDNSRNRSAILKWGVFTLAVALVAGFATSNVLADKADGDKRACSSPTKAASSEGENAGAGCALMSLFAKNNGSCATVPSALAKAASSEEEAASCGDKKGCGEKAKAASSEEEAASCGDKKGCGEKAKAASSEEEAASCGDKKGCGEKAKAASSEEEAASCGDKKGCGEKAKAASSEEEAGSCGDKGKGGCA